MWKYLFSITLQRRQTYIIFCDILDDLSFFTSQGSTRRHSTLKINYLPTSKKVDVDDEILVDYLFWQLLHQWPI